MIQGQEDPLQISTIGIDIGKNTFHFVGFDARGGIVVRRQCSRTQLVRALANLPPCLVGMEACCLQHSAAKSRLPNRPSCAFRKHGLRSTIQRRLSSRSSSHLDRGRGARASSTGILEIATVER
jgi:hypothetical protein